MTNYPERGSFGPCPNCGIREQNQHSNHEGGLCDGITNAHFTPEQIAEIRLKNSRRTANYQRN